MNGRVAILKVHTKGKPLDKTVDPENVARQSAGFSGADLANLVNEAAILAARRNRKVIGMPSSTRRSSGSWPARSARAAIISDAEKAHHRLSTRAATPSCSGSCRSATRCTRSRSSAAAWPSATPWPLPTEDRYLSRKTEFEDKIAGLLGGNAAERLVFGDTTTGASNDIEKATDLARRMVTEWGMSDKLGPLAFGKRDEMIFLGREIGEQRNYSDDVAKMIDEEVRAFIEHGYARATQVLTEYKGEASRPRRQADRGGDGRVRGVREALRGSAAQAEPARHRPGADRIGGARMPRSRPRRRRRRLTRRPVPPEPVVANSIDRAAAWPPGSSHGASDGNLVHPAVGSIQSRSVQPKLESAMSHATADAVPRTPPWRGSWTTRGTPGSSRSKPFCASPASPGYPPTPPTAGPPRSSSPPTCGPSGLEHVEVSETGGHPVVYADWLHAAGKPTVLVYCHYDVQPADPLDLWDIAAIRSRRQGRADARPRRVATASATSACTPRAVEALMKTRGALPVNLSSSSRARRSRVRSTSTPGSRQTRDRLKADFAVISDTAFFEGNLPAITVGLRGLVYFQLDVTGSTIDLHSGGYGGAVDNPINALCAIVAALKGPDGRIRVPGFYDDVVELTALDREALAALPFDEEEYRASLGVPALHGEPGYTTLERHRRPAHARRLRHLGRLRGRGPQDDHPGPCAREDQLPPGGEPGSREDLRARRPVHRGGGADVGPVLDPAVG